MQTNSELLSLAARIVSAHAERTSLRLEDIPVLINRVYIALVGGIEQKEAPPPIETHTVRPGQRTIYPNYLVCLEDGVKLKILKRHLRVYHNMTPEDYKRKWGLPHDYPMTAPNYSSQRRAVALQSGLGRPKRAKRKVH